MNTLLGPICIGVKNTSDTESKIYLLNSYSHLDPVYNVWNQNGDLIQNNYTFIKSLSKAFSYYDLLVMLCENHYRAVGVDIVSKRAMYEFDPSFAIVHRNSNGDGYIDNVIAVQARFGTTLLKDIWTAQTDFTIDGYTDISLVAPPNSEFEILINMNQECNESYDGEARPGYQYRPGEKLEERPSSSAQISAMRFNMGKMFGDSGKRTFATEAREMNRTNSTYGGQFMRKEMENYFRKEDTATLNPQCKPTEIFADEIKKSVDTLKDITPELNFEKHQQKPKSKKKAVAKKVSKPVKKAIPKKRSTKKLKK